MCTVWTKKRTTKKNCRIQCLGGGGDEFSALPVVYPRGTVSVSSLVFFSSVG